MHVIFPFRVSLNQKKIIEENILMWNTDGIFDFHKYFAVSEKLPVSILDCTCKEMHEKSKTQFKPHFLFEKCARFFHVSF